MSGLFSLIGAFVVACLIVRGAVGFYQDYKQHKKQDKN